MIGISASDYVANGRGAHMKIECICTSTVNTAVRHTFTADIMWSGNVVSCWLLNSLPPSSTNAKSGIYQFRCLAPRSDSYGCSVDVRGFDSKERIIDLRILESDCPYTVTTAPSIDLLNSTDYNYTQYDIGKGAHFFGIDYSGNAASASKLQLARSIQTDLASTTAASFNGTKGITPGVTGILPVANGGTGQSDLSNVTVGRATADANGNNIASTYVKSVSKYFFNVIAKNMSYVDPCVLNYVRITPKSGLLSGFVHLKSDSSSNWAVLLISELSTAFGLSFITPSTQRVCGKWVYGDGDSHGDRYGYSATLEVSHEGYIGFGRIHDLAGNYGGWEQSNLGNQRYLVFDSVYLEEN